MNIFFFRFYISILLTFLCIFAGFVSKQLFSFVFSNIKLNYIFQFLKSEGSIDSNYKNIFNYYLFNEQLFMSISCLLYTSDAADD